MHKNFLFISAHFPPDHSGGYGLRIKDIVDGLTELGHNCRVLTTRGSNKKSSTLQLYPYQVYRKLHIRSQARFFPKEVLFDLIDTKTLADQINLFNPDVIYLGHIYPLSKAVLPFLARQTVPLILDEGGASLKGAWTEHGRWFRFTGDYGGDNPLIRLVKPLVIKMVCGLGRGRILPAWHWPVKMHVIINSQHNLEQLRTLGIPLDHAVVLHSGIDLAKFPYKPRASLKPPVRIICPGRLERRKGLLDGVRLLDQLRKAGIDARLTFAGAVGSEAFKHELLAEIQSTGLENQVTIHGMLPQEELAVLYHQADICFFPSYQGMGFSRTLLEAMACGCVVITYGNEGSAEIIEHTINGFILSEGCFEGAATLVNMMISDSHYMRVVRDHARKVIEDKFSLSHYLCQIEQILISQANHFPGSIKAIEDVS